MKTKPVKKHPSSVVYAHSLYTLLNIAGVYHISLIFKNGKIITTEAQYH